MAIGLAVLLGVIGFFVHKNVIHGQQQDTLTAVCQAYLVHEAELPNTNAIDHIRAITVPGSQARLAAAAFSQQVRAAMTVTQLTVVRAQVRLSHVTFSSGAPVRVQADVVVTRQFSPSGHSQTIATGNFLLTSLTHPRLEKVSLNTDPTHSALEPGAFNLNLWNLIPAGPLPHGS